MTSHKQTTSADGFVFEAPQKVLDSKAPDEEYAIVLLDENAGRWLMYHRSDEDPQAPIRVRTAPLRHLR